jgi:hypothetical protein
VLLRRLLRLRLRRLRRLLPPELPDLLLLSPPDAAGTICVNFAISSPPVSWNLDQPYEPYDAARALEPR